MRIDKQTLAWQNGKLAEFMAKTTEWYGLIVEAGIMPISNPVTWYLITIPTKDGKWEEFRMVGKGFDEWEHSRYLYPVECLCDYCAGIGTKKEYIPVSLKDVYRRIYIVDPV